MNYIKNIKYLLLAFTGIIVFSCDTDEFLNPLPDTAISTDGFFLTDQDVLAGIIGIYDALQGVNENTESNNTGFNRAVQFEYLITEHRSDNTRSATLEGSRADFHRYVTDANNIQSEDYWQSMYEIIFRANNLLANVDVADAANIAKYSAEAKFLRAYAYFNLIRLYGSDDDSFGGVPLVTSVVQSDEDELLFIRAPKSAVYAQIVEDLQAGVNNLDNSYKSRASKAAAQGLLAKVYLSQPNPNFTEARNLCQDLMDGTFNLEADFRDVFYNELNNEVIFAISYDFGNENESQGFSSEFTSFNRQGRQDGLNIVNPNLVEAFNENGGNRTAVSYVAFGDDADLVDAVSGLPTPQAAEVAKFLPLGSDVTTDINAPTYGASSRQAGNDWIVLRYADVLLMHTEAILRGSGATSTSDGAALNSFNMVRNRAGLEDDADGSISVPELLLERRVELAFENQRFFDLVRFGVADAVLQNHSAEDNDEDITVYPSYSPRALLLPIPSREINLSKNLLKQNPGYN